MSDQRKEKKRRNVVTLAIVGCIKDHGTWLLLASYSSFMLVSMLLRSALYISTALTPFDKTIDRAASSTEKRIAFALIRAHLL